MRTSNNKTEIKDTIVNQKNYNYNNSHIENKNSTNNKFESKNIPVKTENLKNHPEILDTKFNKLNLSQNIFEKTIELGEINVSKFNPEILPQIDKSNRTSNEDKDNLSFLEKKYLDEKEKNFKIEAEKNIELRKIENKKRLQKKLVSFREINLGKKIKYLDIIICFFILADVSLSVYTNMRFTNDEFDLNEKLVKERFDVDQEIEFLRKCIMVIIIIIEILIIYKYHVKLLILQSSLYASLGDNIFTTGIYKKMFMEMIILCVFTPPNLNGYFKGEMLFGYYTYSSDSFVLMTKMFKLYYLAIIYFHISMWNSESAKLVAKLNKAFKATFKRTPLLTIFILFGLTVVLSSFMMRIFEFGFSQDASDKLKASNKAIKNQQFSSYIDVVWVVIITMMTVGYGEITPKTHLGRAVAFFSSIIGMIIISLLIVRLSDVVELTADEKKALNDIKRHEFQKKINLQSANLIKAIFKLIKIKNNNNWSKKEK